MADAVEQQIVEQQNIEQVPETTDETLNIEPKVDTSPEITLMSSDGKTFKLRKDTACQCVLLKDMLEEADDLSEAIPLPNVTSDVLEFIIKFITHHYNNEFKKIPKPLSGPVENEISEWNCEFLKSINKFESKKENSEFMCKIILGANYINCKNLLNLTCAKVASIISDMTVEEIREYFGVENDFTPEEYQKILDENKWLEDAQ